MNVSPLELGVVGAALLATYYALRLAHLAIANKAGLPIAARANSDAKINDLWTWHRPTDTDTGTVFSWKMDQAWAAEDQRVHREIVALLQTISDNQQRLADRLEEVLGD